MDTTLYGSTAYAFHYARAVIQCPAISAMPRLVNAGSGVDAAIHEVTTVGLVLVGAKISASL